MKRGDSLQEVELIGYEHSKADDQVEYQLSKRTHDLLLIFRFISIFVLLYTVPLQFAVKSAQYWPLFLTVDSLYLFFCICQLLLPPSENPFRTRTSKRR